MCILTVSMSLLASSPARAQNGRQIFDSVINEMNKAIAREQQRKLERQQNEQNQRNWKLFNEMWRDCFDSKIKQRCRDALKYPNINPQDANRLRDFFDVITRGELEAQQQLEEQQRQQDAEQERARREQEEAEARRREEELAEQRRIEAERQAETDRLRRQEEKRLAEERRREAARRLEAERQEQLRREHQAQQAAAARAYAATVADCTRRFVMRSCNEALKSPLVTDDDLVRLSNAREDALAYATNVRACREGSAEACDKALASPAVGNPAEIRKWREAASLYYRAVAYTEAASRATLAFASRTWSSTRALAIATWIAIRDLPASTHVAGGIALLSLAVAAAAIRGRAPAASKPLPPVAPARPRRSLLRQLRRALRRTYVRSLAARRKPVPEPKPTTPAPTRLPVVAADVADHPIDTPAALRALKLAYAYIADVANVEYTDPDACRAARTTLALAAKQLDIAHRADPNAKYELPDDGISLTQARIRAQILGNEALSWGLDNIGKAIAIAERATIADPTYAPAFRILGHFHYENRNRGPAVEALSRALALEPDDVETLKLHDRALNLGVGEMATYKATRVGVGVANAGIGVYNAGVRTYNVFVILWNIFAFVWNTITFPVRLMAKMFNLLFGWQR